MLKEDITVEVVSCLIAEQFPQWASLPVRPVALDGWDNTTFHLGDEMSVRLPSHKRYVPQIDKEHRWLPEIGPQLPLPIPRPLAKGRPGCGFPAAWSIYAWLEGDVLATAAVRDLARLADDLAAFLTALQAISPEGGPPAGDHSFNRGGSVAAWDEETRAYIARLAGVIDAAAALAVWQEALDATWDGPDVWVHGDVTGSNLLVDGDRLCGVIDFGCSAVGDPACDLVMAWTMFDGSSREHFMRGVDCDDGTWARGRGWALWKALNAIPHPDDHRRSGALWGWRWGADRVVDEVIRSR